MITIYRVTEDCFVGKVGDIIKYDTNRMCGEGLWTNINTNKCGSPLVEFNQLEKIE